MKYFPIFLDAVHINALVIGGGDVAARKIELLLKTTNTITIMSAHVNESVERLIKSNQLVWLAHNYQPGLLMQYNLVIAATDQESINTQVAKEAHKANILVNVVDQPALCRYITPAIIDRTPIIIAMSSSGTAPILLRMLREQIEKMLPAGYGKLADFSFKFREHVKARIKGLRNRRTFWEETLRGTIGKMVLSGNIEPAEKLLINSLKNSVAPPKGEIVFIHTLSGEPDKLTLAAHREMQFADAVIYDEAVNEQLIEYIRRDADKFPQSIPSTILINYQHAIELAENGKKVIYLLAGNNPLPANVALSQSAISTQQLVSGL
ncbi:NAD(P)-dependent oxidoreductase [Thalassotalea piscium]|uniref:precorrin-2 dehydrogenase n=1 Tax=Thalassotalea piscium TaxID=1230533 RepID=A0A7X0NHV5_9GAMM|nr:NAD(P)-dependent oxidoreductase [Thalassotalea piscium]MBB6543760.1 uroporphyrin-III C-methyltransferase/precorrin-2 dehydrogenase/sirohydrochlorin ferrochelatase [Thalassotalea piscium]